MRSLASSNGTAESSAVFEDRSDKSQYIANTVMKVGFCYDKPNQERDKQKNAKLILETVL